MPLYQFKVKQKLISHVYVLFSAKHKRVLVFSGNFTPLDDKANHSHTKGNVWAWNEMLLVSIFTILSELGLYHLLFYNNILSLCNANVNREHNPSTFFFRFLRIVRWFVGRQSIHVHVWIIPFPKEYGLH